MHSINQKSKAKLKEQSGIKRIEAPAAEVKKRAEDHLPHWDLVKGSIEINHR